MRTRGDQGQAARAFAAARVVLEERLKLKSDDPRPLAVLAQTDARLRQKELAIREGQHAADLMPMTKDPYAGSLILQGFAQVYTWTGENDRALELLRVLVQMPAYLSYGYLRTDPAWEPLRHR